MNQNSQSQGIGNSTTTTGVSVGNSTATTGVGVGNSTATTGVSVGNSTATTGIGVGNSAKRVNVEPVTSAVKPPSFNNSMIVFFSLYLMIWVFVSVFMITLSPTSLCSMFLIILLNVGICICFLLCIFYSPWNHSLHKKINKSKQKYESIKKDTEQIYQQQIKTFWLNDLNQQTQYYLYAYMLLSFLPFFYGLIAFLANKYVPMDIDNLHLFIVQFSLFYTGLQLLIYSIAVNKWWSIIIPVILFLFMIAIVWNNLTFGLYQTIAIVTLLVITSIVQLKMTSTLGILLSLFLCVGISFLGLMKKLGLRTYQEG